MITAYAYLLHGLDIPCRILVSDDSCGATRALGRLHYRHAHPLLGFSPRQFAWFFQWQRPFRLLVPACS